MCGHELKGARSVSLLAIESERPSEELVCVVLCYHNNKENRCYSDKMADTRKCDDSKRSA